MLEYQTRALVLSQKVFIHPRETEHEHLWLEVLQTMLMETYVTKPSDQRRPRSKNLLRIAEAVQKTNFLSRPMVRDDSGMVMNPSDEFCAVQLVSFPRPSAAIS